MLITIRVPDNATRILYTETDGNGYESEPRNVSFGMFVEVKSDKDVEVSE